MLLRALRKQLWGL